MRDLFCDVPPQESIDANYETRMAHHWIRGDPGLDDQCRECVREWSECGDSQDWLDDRTGCAGGEAMKVLARELQMLVTASALTVEGHGLFLDLFTVDSQEVDWPAIAAFYLDAVAGENGERSGLYPRKSLAGAYCCTGTIVPPYTRPERRFELQRDRPQGNWPTFQGRPVAESCLSRDTPPSSDSVAPGEGTWNVARHGYNPVPLRPSSAPDQTTIGP